MEVKGLPPGIPAKDGTQRKARPPPAFRQKPESREGLAPRHSGKSRNPEKGLLPVIPAKAEIQRTPATTSPRRDKVGILETLHPGRQARSPSQGEGWVGGKKVP